ncbi:hypothetical protein J5N97_007133 [Dioscorea zingiberensis]|uniref:Uncharacterized protein n=1 Tax=Dioscorea zingiberensis TaxID=325984 RepID=A0A9D5DF09_9LILI|nr:hypothetical protein J5N97_007133 [Dioscorea zingiberensis]
MEAKQEVLLKPHSVKPDSIFKHLLCLQRVKSQLSTSILYLFGIYLPVLVTHPEEQSQLLYEHLWKVGQCSATLAPYELPLLLQLIMRTGDTSRLKESTM